MLEAARIDGASNLRILLRIIFPLCGQPMAVLAVVTFVANWNSFVWPLLIIQSDSMKTLTVGIATTNTQFNANLGGIATSAVVSMVPMAMLFILFQRFFVRGLLASRCAQELKHHATCLGRRGGQMASGRRRELPEIDAGPPPVHAIAHCDDRNEPDERTTRRFPSPGPRSSPSRMSTMTAGSVRPNPPTAGAAADPRAAPRSLHCFSLNEAQHDQGDENDAGED